MAGMNRMAVYQRGTGRDKGKAIVKQVKGQHAEEEGTGENV